ncbi:MAG: hypothetical protein IPK03_15095, partial [Bacteroidetes bacterium]|nr:hypothetical protein [Bacteroidota bacterium]
MENKQLIELKILYLNSNVKKHETNNYFNFNFFCNALPISGQSNFLDKYIGSSVTNTVIASSSDQVSNPVDFDFKENSNELWIANYGNSNGSSMVIVYNAGQTNQKIELRKDSHSGHFMIFPTSIAFGKDGFWASANEIKNTASASSTFMGPALWSADTAIFARVFQNP